MRSIGLLLGLTLGASAWGANFHVQSVYPSDTAGNPVTPELGKPFWMTVRYSTDNGGQGTMGVSTSWLHLNSPSFYSDAGQGQATYGPVTPLFDGTFAVFVSVGDSGSQSVTVIPSRPSAGIEYFDPKGWNASFDASLQFVPNANPSVTWVIPQPPTLGFQQVNASRSYRTAQVADGVQIQTGGATTGLSFSATTASVRINSSKLTGTFKDLSKAPKDVKNYLKAETLIESGDRTIKSFVSSTLPRDFAKKLSVFEASRSLYQAVIARVAYTTMSGGRPSAAWTLRNGYGDCGYFSSLFVAACRQAGIPARPVTGFLEGTNQWHIWAEFYVPNAGWVPCDPSFADGLDPQGTYPLYFGVIPEMNRRVATSVGFDHTSGKNKVPILQSPMAFTDSSKVVSFESRCDLGPAGL